MRVSKQSFAKFPKVKKRKPYVQPLSPPKIVTTIQCTHTFSWVNINSTGSQNQVISTAMIMDVLVMATSTSVTYSLIEAFRIKRVDLWGPAQSQTGGSSQVLPNSISLEFNGAGAGNVGTKPTRVIDTPMGASRNACAFLRPPKDSAAADWQVSPESGSQTVGGGIIVSCPFGSILHLTISFILQNGSPPNIGPAPAGGSGVLGTVYQAPLDSTGGVWSALGMPTINV